MLHLSSHHPFCHLNPKICIGFLFVTPSLVTTSDLLLKTLIFNRSNISRTNFWMLSANWNVTLILASNLLPSSQFDDDDDSNGEISTDYKILCTSPLACLSNSSCTFHYLLVTSSMYLSLSSLCNLSIFVTLCACFSSQLFAIFQLRFLHSCCKTHSKHKTWC